jgi:hypothetical protein
VIASRIGDHGAYREKVRSYHDPGDLSTKAPAYPAPTWQDREANYVGSFVNKRRFGNPCPIIHGSFVEFQVAGHHARAHRQSTSSLARLTSHIILQSEIPYHRRFALAPSPAVDETSCSPDGHTASLTHEAWVSRG